MATNRKSTATPIFIVGSTASGKSAVAMELARRQGAAILCMDAMQVYRGADIGTSKPTLAERGEIPHGGLDLVDLGQSFDVAKYLSHAAKFLTQQREAGRRVIVVGGTGLYFRALTSGLCEAPQGAVELRAELAGLSVGELQERLMRVDPGMLERVDVDNPRRLARAIEVMEASGKSLRVWQEETPESLVKDFTALWICREKGELERRIEARVEAMLVQGWAAEIYNLVMKYGIEEVKRFPGIGYREIAEELEANYGKSTHIPREIACDILVATRRYAKRQLTWFAREPKLQRVMLTGSQSIFAALPALL